MSHIPVLADEVIEILHPQPGEFFVDATVGNGGHAKKILKKIGSNGTLLGIDWDEKAIEELRNKTDIDTRLILAHNNYANVETIIKENNLPKADGLLLDLGLSSTQLEKSGRGFSFRKDEPLDMRYNEKEGETAAMIINSYPEKELAKLLWKYGEVGNARNIAKAMIKQRKKKRIETTGELIEIIESATTQRGKIHPATQTFMALRIFVNHELKNLEKLLETLPRVIAPEGRVAIVSFHSLEDRMIKNSFRDLAQRGRAELLTKKPIRPTTKEIKKNPRSRSAKLRAIQIK
jgi:16S rRNA (cytosine1402-N4)-methyltransferase